MLIQCSLIDHQILNKCPNLVNNSEFKWDYAFFEGVKSKSGKFEW